MHDDAKAGWGKGGREERGDTTIIKQDHDLLSKKRHDRLCFSGFEVQGKAEEVGSYAPQDGLFLLGMHTTRGKRASLSGGALAAARSSSWRVKKFVRI